LQNLLKKFKRQNKTVIFDIPYFKDKLNILHYETLNLADLKLIPAITSDEVNLQVDKTILAFSSVNSK
jgi:hypothetical protein